MIEPDRITVLNNQKLRDRSYVVYWMQASQRTHYNHALEFAIQLANELNRMLVVFFGLTAYYPGANVRHYAFILEGLQEVQEDLHNHGIQMVIWRTSPEVGITEFSKDACLVVTDRGYTDIQRDWRTYVAEHINCPLFQVESDVVVPVEIASHKQEYSARTIRPKIENQVEHYLEYPAPREVEKSSLHLTFDSFSINNIEEALTLLGADNSVNRVSTYIGGHSHAHNRLERFIGNGIDHYDDWRNDPSKDAISHLSPYLHFGQISPVEIAIRVKEANSPGKAAFLEELIVRRELAINYCFYNPDYKSLRGIPAWAQQTLAEHAADAREYLYSREEFETGQTHDPYWNAAQLEMVQTGKMHGYMRMYWGKKILEWSVTPKEAFKTALYLNDKYQLDGRDPSGYTGIAWCFGTHDRGWKDRPIYGKVRYMNASGLRRKFDIDAYVRQVEKLKRSEVGERQG